MHERDFMSSNVAPFWLRLGRDRHDFEPMPSAETVEQARK
jgi:hypothetical protein